MRGKAFVGATLLAIADLPLMTLLGAAAGLALVELTLEDALADAAFTVLVMGGAALAKGLAALALVILLRVLADDAFLAEVFTGLT